VEPLLRFVLLSVYDQLAFAEPVAVPPEVTATKFGQLALKALPFQHKPLSFWIETSTALMPWLPVPLSETVPVTEPGQPELL
jgi:hypothetical protein